MTALYLVPSEQGPFGPPQDQHGLSGSTVGERRRILVVEDEFLVSMEIEAALQSAGYVVAGVATSYEEAVALAGATDPDLVLMDIRLRGAKDGIDAAIEIKRRFGLQCVFVSAHVDELTRERGQAANPLGWISKPFVSQRLLDTVRAALRRYSPPGA